MAVPSRRSCAVHIAEFMLGVRRDQPEGVGLWMLNDHGLHLIDAEIRAMVSYRVVRRGDRALFMNLERVEGPALFLALCDSDAPDGVIDARSSRHVVEFFILRLMDEGEILTVGNTA